MPSFEGLVIAYLTFFVLAAPFARVERRRWMGTAVTAGLCAVAVYAMSRAVPITVRLWLPFLYISLGYWIPVPLVSSRGGGAFEAWLRRSDEALRGIVRAMPRTLTYAAEVGYLFCFPLVPVAFAVVWRRGSPADVERAGWRGDRRARERRVSRGRAIVTT